MAAEEGGIQCQLHGHIVSISNVLIYKYTVNVEEQTDIECWVFLLTVYYFYCIYYFFFLLIRFPLNSRKRKLEQVKDSIIVAKRYIYIYNSSYIPESYMDCKLVLCCIVYLLKENVIYR